MGTPPPEVDVDEPLVRSLLVEQFPALADLRLRYLGSGWDNVLWRLGDHLVVRLPRRSVAVDLLRNEQRWLPELAARLPLPVPAPVAVGRATPHFPWPWTLVPWIPGRPADGTPVTDHDDAATRLGAFLRALHRPAPAAAPGNPWRGVPLAARSQTLQDRLAHLADHVDGAAVRRRWQAAVETPPHRAPPVWLHGDLHPGNLLVADGTLAGVVDFGDLCAGDPATDVAAAWMLLPTTAFDVFSAAYGGVEPRLRRRSLGWAVLFALLLLDIDCQDRPTYAHVARTTLDRVLAAAP